MSVIDLKDKMKKLWKDTFHDSDAYISLIFENYFDPEFVEYYEEKNQLISALLGIPYEFGNGHNTLRGLYLCGLATKEDYRHRGIMTNLLSNINNKAKDKGFAFTFLIPASDMLRISYQGKGYVNSMYRVEERYTDIHDFQKDCISVINHEEEKLRKYRLKYFDRLKVKQYIENAPEIIEKISNYISTNEHEFRSYSVLQHSLNDIQIILKESELSGGEIWYVVDENDEIRGVVFVTFDERKRMLIPKIYYDDHGAYYKLLDKIKKVHPESPISIWRYPEETDRQAIWSKVYGAANPEGLMMGGTYGVTERVYDVNKHSQPYGMCKILNFYEILKYIAADRKDVKFSILVKADNHPEKGLMINVAQGKVEQESVEGQDYKKLSNTRTTTVLSSTDAAEIIFRKKDGNSLIMEAFGIPRLAIDMALMLD